MLAKMPVFTRGDLINRPTTTEQDII